MAIIGFILGFLVLLYLTVQLAGLIILHDSFCGSLSRSEKLWALAWFCCLAWAWWTLFANSPFAIVATQN